MNARVLEAIFDEDAATVGEPRAHARDEVAAPLVRAIDAALVLERVADVAVCVFRFLVARAHLERGAGLAQ